MDNKKMETSLSIGMEEFKKQMEEAKRKIQSGTIATSSLSLDISERNGKEEKCNKTTSTTKNKTTKNTLNVMRQNSPENDGMHHRLEIGGKVMKKSKSTSSFDEDVEDDDGKDVDDQHFEKMPSFYAIPSASLSRPIHTLEGPSLQKSKGSIASKSCHNLGFAVKKSLKKKKKKPKLSCAIPERTATTQIANNDFLKIHNDLFITKDGIKREKLNTNDPLISNSLSSSSLTSSLTSLSTSTSPSLMSGGITSDSKKESTSKVETNTVSMETIPSLSSSTTTISSLSLSSSSSSSTTTTTTTTISSSSSSTIKTVNIKEDSRDGRDKRPKISFENLRKIYILGSGMSATVHLVRDLSTRKKYAQKDVPCNNQKTLGLLCRELQCLYECKCKYIVNLCDAFYRDDRIYFLLEYMQCSLRDLLNACNGRLSEGDISIIAQQLLKGIKYLHEEKKIIHRDIKPENILLNEKGRVKLSDFGLSKQKTTESQGFSTFVGTYCYMSIERLEGKSHSFDSDIWSLGITLYECYLGHHPFKDLKDLWDIMKALEDENFDILSPLKQQQGVGTDFLDFLGKCLKKKSDERSNAGQLLRHPFIKNHATNEPSSLIQFVKNAIEYLSKERKKKQ